jgi:hypothetical protein
MKQSGIISSPNWPRNYEHNLNCTWHIRVPKHKVSSVAQGQGQDQFKFLIQPENRDA